MALYKALFDFEGQEASELSVQKDEVLMAHGEPQDDWLLVVRESNPGSSGYVPMGYLERIAAPPSAPKAQAPGIGPSVINSLFDFPPPTQHHPPSSNVFRTSNSPIPAFTDPFGTASDTSFTPIRGWETGQFDAPAPFTGTFASGKFPADGATPAGSGTFFGAASQPPPPTPPPLEPTTTRPFPGGLPREPLSEAPLITRLYPALPPIEPIAGLKVYDDAFAEQLRTLPEFQEIDGMLGQTSASLQQLREQHLNVAGQLQRVRDHVEAEGARIQRQQAAAETLSNSPATLPALEVTDDPLPAVNYLYRKFLSPNRPYAAGALPSSAVPGPSSAGAANGHFTSGPSAAADTEAQELKAPFELEASPPASPINPEAAERRALQSLHDAEVAIQKVRDQFEELALTPLAVAVDPSRVVHARSAYDELLLQQMMKVDCVDSHGIDAIRQCRKELLRSIEKLHHSLDDIIKQEMAAR